MDVWMDVWMDVCMYVWIDVLLNVYFLHSKQCLVSIHITHQRKHDS